MVRKIITDYRKLSDGNFVTKVSNIITAMTGNPDFPTPIPPLSDLSAALGEFVTAMAAAGEGGKALVEIKNQKRIALAELVSQLGLFIMYTANGNTTVLVSGMLDTSVRRPSGAKSFLYQLTSDPLTAQSTWQSVPGSKTKYTFTDLTPGQKYWVRFGAVGKGSEIAFSDPYLSRFVQ